jgi:pimeloyl-ACP methyl ester carboxylesterase
MPPARGVGHLMKDGRVTSPALVLLHGQPDTSASFWLLRRELSARLDPTLRIMLPDRPGYGANQVPATDFSGNVSWLLQWLRQSEIGPVVLVAHSWAGGVGILATAAREHRICALVLVSSIGPHCLLPIDAALALPIVGELVSFATLRVGRPVLRRTAQRLLDPRTPDPDRPYAMASRLAMRHRPVWRSFLGEQRALVRDLDVINAALPEIDVPTLVMDGDADTMIPGATPAALAAAIPRAARVSLAGGHDLQLREPVPVAEAVSAFLYRTVLSG